MKSNHKSANLLNQIPLHSYGGGGIWLYLLAHLCKFNLYKNLCYLYESLNQKPCYFDIIIRHSKRSEESKKNQRRFAITNESINKIRAKIFWILRSLRSITMAIRGGFANISVIVRFLLENQSNPQNPHTTLKGTTMIT